MQAQLAAERHNARAFQTSTRRLALPLKQLLTSITSFSFRPPIMMFVEGLRLFAQPAWDGMTPLP